MIVHYPLTVFTRPHGQQHESTMALFKEDAEWLADHKAKLSIENCGGFLAIYVDLGFRFLDEPDGDPDEVTLMAPINSSSQLFMRSQMDKLKKEIDSGRKVY